MVRGPKRKLATEEAAAAAPAEVKTAAAKRGRAANGAAKKAKVNGHAEEAKKAAAPAPAATTELAETKLGKKRRQTEAAPPAGKKPKVSAAAAAASEVFRAVRERPDDEGVVLTLGTGDTGQLGLGEDLLERAKPALVKSDAMKGVVAVCAGGMHSLCLTRDGKVYSFGCNDDGALGRATADDEECFAPAPVDVPGVVVQISAGDSHSVALTEEGRVFYWGTFRDSSGPYGLTADGSGHNVPVRLAEHLTVRKVASGSDHVALLTADGQVYTLGTAEQGQLGRVGERFARRGGRRGLALLLQPDRVHAKNRRVVFSDIWAGAYNTYALTTAGDVLVCGLNNYRQLGVPGSDNQFFTLVKSAPLSAVSRESGWRKIVPGQHHTVLLDGKSRVFVLGRKEYGRLGLGEDDGAGNRAAEDGIPTQVPGVGEARDVGAGTAVSFAVDTAGRVTSWGMGTNGQLGQEDDDDAWKPERMLGKQLEARRVLQVSGGGQHTMLLAADNED